MTRMLCWASRDCGVYWYFWIPTVFLLWLWAHGLASFSLYSQNLLCEVLCVVFGLPLLFALSDILPSSWFCLVFQQADFNVYISLLQWIQQEVRKSIYVPVLTCQTCSCRYQFHTGVDILKRSSKRVLPEDMHTCMNTSFLKLSKLPFWICYLIIPGLPSNILVTRVMPENWSSSGSLILATCKWAYAKKMVH